MPVLTADLFVSYRRLFVSHYRFVCWLYCFDCRFIGSRWVRSSHRHRFRWS
ncbi:unnamed protein product [Arabidopsis halleri]